ncbi:MAG TPA: RraA family protein [Mycobacterium sp.]|nr:RraA family protein [Mycobacterium sp.]
MDQVDSNEWGWTEAVSDTYALARWFKHFRVTDVTDALDAVGRQDLTLMDERIRPLWEGLRFWGPAVTVRALPANVRMPKLTAEDAVKSHAIWFAEHGRNEVGGAVKNGCVVVTSTDGVETGIWGSNNSLDLVARGAVGVLTDGHARDTDELILQKTPVACRGRGRTIIPGRVIFTGVNEPIGCGGVLVRPGDIIGCDGDGCVVVPAEVVDDVVRIAKGILLDDVVKRRKLYQRLGMAMDATVAVEEMEAFYAGL